MRLGEYQTTAGGMVTSADPQNHDTWQGFIRELHAAHERGEVVVVGEDRPSVLTEHGIVCSGCGWRGSLSAWLHNSGASAWAAQVVLDTLRGASRVDGSVEFRIDNPEVAKAWHEGQERITKLIGAEVAKAIRAARPLGDRIAEWFRSPLEREGLAYRRGLEDGMRAARSMSRSGRPAIPADGNPVD